MALRPAYRSQFKPLTGWSPYDCGPATAAMALDRDTLGQERTDHVRVRTLTNDRSGGTTLEQLDIALRVGWPGRDHLDVRPRIAFDDAVAMTRRGQAGIWTVNYGVLADAGLDGSPGFRGSHFILISEISGQRALKYDPTCDRRRTGIPQDPTWMGLDTLRRAAGLLLVDPDTGTRLGLGSAQVAFTRDTEPDYLVAVKGDFWRYIVNRDGLIVEHYTHHSGGLSAKVAAPRLMRWVSTSSQNPRSLVQVQQPGSPINGWYLQPGSKGVTLRRLS
jgi:hypothetical protein